MFAILCGAILENKQISRKNVLFFFLSLLVYSVLPPSLNACVLAVKACFDESLERKLFSFHTVSFQIPPVWGNGVKRYFRECVQRKSMIPVKKSNYTVKKFSSLKVYPTVIAEIIHENDVFLK